MASSGRDRLVAEVTTPPPGPVKREHCANARCARGDFNATTDNNYRAAHPANEAANGTTTITTNAAYKSLSHSNSAEGRVMKAGVRSTGTRRPASLPPGELNNASGAHRKRGSYHQDVEEALSSLLWQPYEYRTQSDSSDTLSTLSLSTGSSSSTSLSYEYANRVSGGGGGGGGGGMLHSFTDEFLSMATPPQPAPGGSCSGNPADPNLRCAQMVSNLMVLDAAAVGLGGHQSRVPDGGPALRQRDSGRSRVRELVSKCARLSLGTATAVQQRQLRAVRDLASAVSVCDDALVSGGDMRVEIPGSGPEPRQPDVTYVKTTTTTTATAAVHQQQPNVVYQCSSIAVDGGGNSSSSSGDCVSVQTRVVAGDGNRSVCVSSDMIPSNITSVVSANVVGLPVHSRSSSNLSARTDIVPPNHPRSVSETANVFVQPALHFRSSSNQATDRLLPTSRPISVTTATVTPVRAASEGATTPSHGRQDSATSTGHNQSRVPPLPNVSNVNVNFYRAVPVNVVANVPTIQCLNSVEDTLGNNVSNVHIVQAMPQISTAQQVLIHQPAQVITEVRTRTFTSTEAQTDDTAVGPLVAPTVLPSSTREQRRRERRERRHQRRLNSSNHQHPHQQQHQTLQQQQHQWLSANGSQSANDRLPDLLNSHLPPAYSTLPSGVAPPPPPQLAVVAGPPPPGTLVPFHHHPGIVPVVQGAPPPVPVPVQVAASHSGFRFPFPTAAGFRRCRSRLGPRYSTEEHQPKSCCGFLVSRPGSLRWFIALIALVAVCCVLVGTVLGAMRPAGRDHLTVSLLMIGVGIVLVTVSGVAWRLTSHDAPSCRAMLGLDAGDSSDVCARRFVPRLPPSYGRPHHPYAAMIYPEFQYRPPPPSYQASMQEYRLRLLLLDRVASAATNAVHGAQHAVSPPPTYRSHAGSLLRAPLSNRRDATQSEYSCPPSYRSRTSSNRQPSNDTTVHSREQSLSLSESNHDGSVNVVNILANQEEEIALENMTLDSLKVAPENEIPPLRMMLKSSSGSDLEALKDGNLVTIVQKADQNPVIVTVSGSQMSTTNPDVGSSHQIPSEMEILAHL